MPFPGNTFYRSELDHSVLKEMDEHNAVLNGFLSREHGPDGTHTNITAESVTAGLVTANVMAQYLRFHPYKSYTLRQPTDPIAFADVGDDPVVSLWYANSTAAATVNGMYVSDLIRGVPGHVQLIVNNSTFPHTYQSAVVTNARRLYGCVTPVVVPPGGTILFVYDGRNLGWRLVGSSAGAGGGGGVELPPFIAFTNVSNPWTAGQVFPHAGLGVANQTGTNGALKFVDVSAVVPDHYLYFNLKYQFLTLNINGNATIDDWFDQSVKTTASPTFAAVTAIGTVTGNGIYGADWMQCARFFATNAARIGGTSTALKTLHVGTGAETPLLSYPGAVVQTAGDVAQVSARYCSGGAASVEGGFFAHSSGVFMGSWTNTMLQLRVNNTPVLRFDPDLSANFVGGHVNASPGYQFQGNIIAPVHVIANDYVWAGARLFVQGFRVTVTADCTIPGSGGGVELPPYLAYLNVIQNWAPKQHFDGGISVQGVDWNTWFNQCVRTDCSPTFASLIVNGRLTLNAAADPDGIGLAVTGRITSSTTIEAANAFIAQGRFGRTATIAGVGTFVGGILVT